MRMFTLMTATAVAALCAGFTVSPSKAQTAAQPCGVETYSAADQRYVTLPCNGAQTAAPQGQAAQGQSQANCGIETYSAADQRYVGVPCAATTQKSADGKESCGVETYSVADQKYVGVPCSHK